MLKMIKIILESCTHLWLGWWITECSNLMAANLISSPSSLCVDVFLSNILTLNCSCFCVTLCYVWMFAASNEHVGELRLSRKGYKKSRHFNYQSGIGGQKGATKNQQDFITWPCFKFKYMHCIFKTGFKEILVMVSSIYEGKVFFH